MDAEVIETWLGVLDQISYYELFRIPTYATQDEIKYAFHTFAEDFHPDAHAWRPAEERRKIDFIFRRGTEAHRILTDPTLRMQYDTALAQGDRRPAWLVSASVAPSGGTASVAPKTVRLVDQLRRPSSRPFVMKAQELEKKGDFKQAKLQLAIALNLEGDNAPLQEFAKKLEEKARDPQKK
jgi:DnaJ-class molecular chaperone